MTRHQDELELKLVPALERSGLSVFGWFLMDHAPYKGQAAVLVGNRPIDGKHLMWEVFSYAGEAQDGLANPLERWSERVIRPIAAAQNAVPLFPFGEKIWPFQHFARLAPGMKASPVGMLIDPEYGLWQAFRAVLIFDEQIVLTPQKVRAHPCSTCEDKPCLNACPVSAYDQNGFDVNACRAHLNSGKKPDCMRSGCQARASCPVGIAYRDEQIQFHMNAFNQGLD